KVIFQSVQQAVVVCRLAQHGGPAVQQDASCAVEVVRLAGQETESVENLRGNAVAGGQRAVRIGFVAKNQCFAIVGGEVKTTLLAIFEIVADRFGQKTEEAVVLIA